ncbi:MAG: hypothetical protein EOM90_10775 [Alphaproteobacteria bacterium]|nr:hypothetical protein [Alphaproteobacteria bacterium]
MPEIVIKYKSTKTLDLLKDLSKYFDFVLSSPKSLNRKKITVNGVTFIPADHNIDTSDLIEIFSGRQIDAKMLREKAWQRK